jgi:hypothetical protein
MFGRLPDKYRTSTEYITDNDREKEGEGDEGNRRETEGGWEGNGRYIEAMYEICGTKLSLRKKVSGL